MRARVGVHPPTARSAALSARALGTGWEPAALVGATLILLAFGLVTLWSASAFLARQGDLVDHYYVLRQAMGAAVGLAVLATCARVPVAWWRGLAWPMLVGSSVLLLLLILPFTTGMAPEVNGARRWLTIFGITFQPSEFAKIALIAWTAHTAVRKHDHFGSIKRGLGPFMVGWSLILVPVLFQPDFSTACLILALGLIVLFLGGAWLRHFALLGVVAVPVLWLQLGVGFRWDRILAFLNPASDPSGAGFQLRQSLIAVGSGGVTGVGFGEGRQKYGFLPEPHNDFIFAMIGEEWGLVGVSIVVLLYLSIVLIGFRIARRATDPFAQLFAAGLASLVGLHAFLHMAVGLGLVPVTGLPLPLISYGRSNLLVTLAAIGMLMSISRAQPVPRGARG